MSAALTLGSAVSGALQQQSWLYVAAGVFAVAGIAYAALRSRNTASAPE